jgi:outer membrane protein TolC
MNQHMCVHLKSAACIAVFLLLCISTRVTAQQPLNLYDAANRAIANYPLIRQREADVAAGRAHINTVNGNRLPSLLLNDQLTVGTSNSLDGSYFPLGIVPSTSGSINATNNSAASTGNVAISFLQWEFYNFGYYRAQTKEAKAQLAINQANLNSDKYLLTENIISLYLDWLKKYRLLQIENENVQRAGTILTAIRATVMSGLKPGVDSATASAAYSDARISYLQALDNYNYDKISLSAYTALDTNDIVPDTTIISQEFQNQVFQFQPSDSITTDHPLLNVYQKQYEQQLADNNAISKKYLPKLSLDGAAWVRGSSISPTDVYATDLATLPYSRSNYLFGLTLSYNVFDIKHRHDQLMEGRYEAQARQSAVQNEQLDLNRMLQQANSAYTTTTAKLAQLPVQLHSAQQAYGQQMALYHSGLNTLIDVTNALYVLRQSETNYVIAQDELMQLLYIRAGLSNQLDIFLQNFKR